MTINGEKKAIQAEPRQLLIDVLRNEGYFGIKRGCQEGSCGSCTILIDNKPYMCCIMFVGQAHKRDIRTIEGFGDVTLAHPIQNAFVENAATQCGFCIPGMVTSAVALLEVNNDPSEDEIKEALAGNICRCTGYVKQLKAVKDAAKAMRGD